MNKSYQRRHLRAPFKEAVLYQDGPYVLKAMALNISESGMLIGELPSFPEKDEVPLIISLPQMPLLKNLGLVALQSFSLELFQRRIIRLKAKLVRREQLSKDLDNIFRSSFGLEFVRISPQDEKLIEQYVLNFASNLIYLQTLIDSFNVDEQTRLQVRALSKILGYESTDKISQLRARVTHDYKSLQWI